MDVRTIMSKPVVTVREDTMLDEVARLMLDRGIGSVVVVDEHRQATGIVTERDFSAQEPANPFQRHRPTMLFGKNVRRYGLENLYGEARRIRAGQVQRPMPAVLARDDPVERAVALMNRHEVLHLVVLEDAKPVGVVSRHDLLQLAAMPPDGVGI